MVLRTAGTNCDQETAFAFQSAGAIPELVHINKLFKGSTKLRNYQILALPGGFTYGDDIAAGRILANELRIKLGKDIRQFIKDGKLIIGICNGFQVLVKAGILPGIVNKKEKKGSAQTATLMINDSGKFEDRWTYLRTAGRCIWTEGIDPVVYFPVAHGEGKFVPQNEEVLNELKNNQQIVFRYCSSNGGTAGYPLNPNGSIDDIAGITDPTGQVLGLMPHPERHLLFTQHPRWTRLNKKAKYGHGAKIFINGVNYIRGTIK